MCMMSDSSQDLVPTGGNLRVMSMYANCLIFCVYASWLVQRGGRLLVCKSLTELLDNSMMLEYKKRIRGAGLPYYARML